MNKIPARPISKEEAALVRSALLRASIEPISDQTMQSIDALNAIGVCECGCGSVEFEVPEGKVHRLADGAGFVGNGDRVDIMVWAREGRIASLEIVNYQGSGELPPPESVCSWEEAARR